MFNQFPAWAGEMNRLRDEMNRAFGSRFGEPVFQQRAYPPVNVWEDDDNLYVEAELPGLEMEAIEIFADGNHLSIQGNRNAPEGEQRGLHRQERSFGKFSRMIELPVAIDSNGTSAEYRLGVLKITLPKLPEARPRRITVNVAS